MGNIMKKIFVVLLIPVFCINVYSAEQKLKVYLNGEAVVFSNSQPVIVNGRTLIPLRGLFEKMGYTIDWEPATKTATLINGSSIISMRSGHKALQVNQNSTFLDVPAQIINNSMMIPLRAISEATGASVNWDANTKTVHIGTVTRQISPEITIAPYISRYMSCIAPLDEVTENILFTLNSINDENITDKLAELRESIDGNIETIEKVSDELAAITPEPKFEQFHIKAKDSVVRLGELAELIKNMLINSYDYNEAEAELKVILSEAQSVNAEMNALAAAIR